MIDSVEMIIFHGVYFFSPFRTGSEPKIETLRGIYPEPRAEILRFAQDDRRRAQGDKAKGSE